MNRREPPVSVSGAHRHDLQSDARLGGEPSWHDQGGAVFLDAYGAPRDLSGTAPECVEPGPHGGDRRLHVDEVFQGLFVEEAKLHWCGSRGRIGESISTHYSVLANPAPPCLPSQ